MELAVKVMLVGVFEANLHHGRLWRHMFFVASNRARRLVFFQSEASPQQAEFLTAVVRQI